MENGNKKKQRVDLILGVLCLGRAGLDRVHTCPSRHRHQEERQYGAKGRVRRDRPRVQEPCAEVAVPNS